MNPYRSLDPQKVISTLEQLHARVVERFPDSGLASVALEALNVARENASRVRKIMRPDPLLRSLIVLILIAAASILVAVGVALQSESFSWAPSTGSELIQEIEAALGIVVFLGAAFVYLTSLEARSKRSRALAAIHELRSIAHIVDMHQLTKDPERSTHPLATTASSPKRNLSPFLLSRYLDYCSELVALVAKIAALYAQSLDDSIAVAAVDDIENLTSGLSRKIWQKIMLLDRMNDGTFDLPDNSSAKRSDVAGDD